MFGSIGLKLSDTAGMANATRRPWAVALCSTKRIGHGSDWIGASADGAGNDLVTSPSSSGFARTSRPAALGRCQGAALRMDLEVWGQPPPCPTAKRDSLNFRK